ncbi:MAG: DUF748 domain-containing protein, partial [Burkholderiales bacterium]|nr:DUF748 domain-containing protein [Burkholderiales bacterium]
MSPIRRWSLIAIAAITILVIGVFIAYQIALSELRSRVINALGTQSEVGEIQVSFKDITITDLKLNAPAGWPARHVLTAERVVIAPDLGSFTAGLLRINRIRIERATLTALRDRTGKLRVLPSFTEKVSATGKSSTAAVPARAVLIESITLKDSTISFFDEEVRSPPLQVKLENVEASITNLRVPELTGKSVIDIKANVSGPTQRGTLAISGNMAFATRNGNINTRLRDVEIAALEPYLIKAAETGVRKGTLDLDLAANVEAQRLIAPGKLVLKGLELRSNEKTTSTFMGMPRDAVINLIRDRDGRIEVPFT